MRDRSDAFEALAEAVDALVFVTDTSMRMLFASAALERETGFTVADFQLPQADNPFIHREDADHVARALAAFVTGDRPVSDPIENRFLDRWGRTHGYVTRVSKVSFDGAPALLFVCRATAAIAQTADDRQYRALVDLADDAILRIDNAGRILFANRRACELFDSTTAGLGRLRLDDLVEPRDRILLTDRLSHVIGTRERVRFALHLLASQKDQRRIEVHAVVTPLGPYGNAGELLVILRQ
jgi:PAS domain S-box-containing protein